jgi:hypothetical protein
MGFVAEDSSVCWEMNIFEFMRQFESEKAAVSAFNNRREYVLGLAQALSGV